MESVHGLEQVFGGLEHLHAQVDVQDGYARLIEEIAHHGAARHVCGPVKADVDLPLEALAKKAVGNGAQVVDALANAHLNGTAAGGCGTGVEIRQARQHQAVAGLGHFQGESLADDGLAVQRQSAVHLHRAHRHDDDIVAF